MITVITLFVVLDILGVEDAAIGASRGRAGRLFRDRMAALVRVYYSGAHAGGWRAGGRAGGARWHGVGEGSSALVNEDGGRRTEDGGGAVRRGDWRGAGSSFPFGPLGGVGETGSSEAMGGSSVRRAQQWAGGGDGKQRRRRAAGGVEQGGGCAWEQQGTRPGRGSRNVRGEGQRGQRGSKGAHWGRGVIL